MTDMQAALGLRQLEVLDDVLAERTRLADALRRRARAASRTSRLPTSPSTPAHLAVLRVRVGSRAPIGRTELMRRLLHDGIATRRGVMAIHQEPAYAGPCASRPAPHRGRRRATSLMLPLFPGLSDEQQDYVIDRLAAHASALAA